MDFFHQSFDLDLVLRDIENVENNCILKPVHKIILYSISPYFEKIIQYLPIDQKKHEIHVPNPQLISYIIDKIYRKLFKNHTIKIEKLEFDKTIDYYMNMIVCYDFLQMDYDPIIEKLDIQNERFDEFVDLVSSVSKEKEFHKTIYSYLPFKYDLTRIKDKIHLLPFTHLIKIKNDRINIYNLYRTDSVEGDSIHSFEIEFPEELQGGDFINLHSLVFTSNRDRIIGIVDNGNVSRVEFVTINLSDQPGKIEHKIGKDIISKEENLSNYYYFRPGPFIISNDNSFCVAINDALPIVLVYSILKDKIDILFLIKTGDKLVKSLISDDSRYILLFGDNDDMFIYDSDTLELLYQCKNQYRYCYCKGDEFIFPTGNDKFQVLKRIDNGIVEKETKILSINFGYSNSMFVLLLCDDKLIVKNRNKVIFYSLKQEMDIIKCEETSSCKVERHWNIKVMGDFIYCEDSCYFNIEDIRVFTKSGEMVYFLHKKGKMQLF